MEGCYYNWTWGDEVVKAQWKVLGSITDGLNGDFFRGIRQFHVPGVD
jgi:hypothetical protein